VKAYDKGDGGGASKDLVSSFLMHQIYLSRYSTYEARKLVKILDTANSFVKQRLLKAKSIETKKHYERIASEIRRIMNEAAESLNQQLEFDFIDLADEEIQFVEKTMSKFTVKAEFDLPAPKKVWAAASFGPYAGPDGKYTFQTYLNSLSDDLMRLWDINLRTGYLLGLPSRTILRNVLGSVKDQYPGQIQKLRKSLEANTRTALSFMANEARNAVYKANSSLFDGYKFLATLDSRTCVVCGTDDGRIFPTLEEAPKPPLHLRCRCILLPYIRGFEDIEGARASMNGEVSDKMTYKDWLAQQDPAVQEEILGKYRYEAYKNGVSIDSFAPDGRTLSLKELRAKEVIPDIYPRVFKAKREVLQEQTNQYFDKLDDNVKKQVGDYTTDYYTDINNALHGNIRMTDNIKGKITGIDTAIDGFEIKENMTVFRGTNAAYYSDWETGGIKKFDAYASTSVLKSEARWFYKRQNKLGNEPIMLEIRVPAGTKGLYIGGKTDFKVNQAELLLSRGLSYKVIEKIAGYMLLEVIK
jgi:SPP1 gp7 family putative phage head morphogenesis protein